MSKTYTKEERKKRKRHFNPKTRSQTFNRRKYRDTGYHDFDYMGYYLGACRRKIGYSSYAEAMKAKKGSEKTFKKPMEIYQCPVCGKYHLTSTGWGESEYLLADQEKEPIQKGKR